MKDVFKKIGSYILTFIIGIGSAIAFICGRKVLSNKRDGTDRAEELANEGRAEAERAREAISGCTDINRELREDNRRAQDILDAVGKRQPISPTAK